MDIEKIKSMFIADGGFFDNGINHRDANEFVSDNYYVNEKFGANKIKVEFINKDLLVKWHYKPHVSAGKFYRGKDIPDGTTVNQLLSGALEEMNRLYHCIS